MNVSRMQERAVLEEYCRGLVRPDVLRLEGYVPGSAPASAGIVRISANENGFGTPPAILDALKRYVDDGAALNRYPDGSCRELRRALSGKFALPEDWFVVGNGLDDVINILALTYLAPGDEVVVPAMTFVVYAGAARAMGATPVVVPMARDLSIDLDAVGGAVTERTKMVVVCNPNNPTGTVVKKGAFDRLLGALASLPRAPLFVLDQAYVDYMPAEDEDAIDVKAVLLAHGNVVALRTFSKMSGLAGLRVGYAIARPEVISHMYRVRPPYTVNALAQLAALVDVTDRSVQAFKAEVSSGVAEERRKLEAFFAASGVRYVPSRANFVFAFFDRPYEDLKDLSEALEERGILVRLLVHEAGPCGLRFSIGTPGENERLIEALKTLLARGTK